VDAGQRAQTPLLARRRQVQLDQRADDFRALAVVEHGAASDLLAPVVEPRAHRQQQRAAATQRARLAQSEEAVVLVRHDLFVEVAGEHERGATLVCVGIAQPREASAIDMRCKRLRPSVDHARKIAEVVCERRRERERGPRGRVACDGGGEQPLLAIELGVDPRCEGRRLVGQAERESASESARAHGEPLAVVSGDAVRDARRHQRRIALRGFVDARARGGEHVRVVDRHPVVVPNVRVDVGRNERGDGRVVCRKPQPEGAHTGEIVERGFGARAGPGVRLIGGVEQGDERRRRRRVPQPRGCVPHLFHEQGIGDADSHAAGMIPSGERARVGCPPPPVRAAEQPRR